MRFLDWLARWRRKPPPLPPPPPPPPSPPPPPGGGGEGGLLAAVNQSRAGVGRPPLAGDAALDAIASSHARAMAAAGVLAHEGLSDGSFGQRLARAGVSGHPAGEVIAQGSEDVAGTMLQWMGSPPHRAILLGDFTRLGGGRSGDYWCADVIR